MRRKTKATINNQKGFTLMELLIVVAIIGILVAVGFPVVSNQLEKAREATDLANIRSKYTEVMIEVLETDAGEGTVDLVQKVDGWVQGSTAKSTLESLGDVSGEPTEKGQCVIKWQADKSKVLFKFGGNMVMFPKNPEDPKYNDDFAKSYAELADKYVNMAGTKIPLAKLQDSLEYVKANYHYPIAALSSDDGNYKTPIINQATADGYSGDIIEKINSGQYTVFFDENNNLLGVKSMTKKGLYDYHILIQYPDGTSYTCTYAGEQVANVQSAYDDIAAHYGIAKIE